jgi:uncharacterized protein YjiS (DUF1127 family)
MVQAGKGSLNLFKQDETTMSLLNHTSDYSSAPFLIRRSIRSFGRGIFRAINTAIAVLIAQREHQANLTILRNFTDRELRDIGLSRNQIGIAGLAEAAKDRMRVQRQLAARS